jgi:hypothetical protein
MSEELTLEDFAPHLHTRLRIADLDDYELELTEINDCSNAQLEQFSLIFTGPGSPWLPQGLYRLVHPKNVQPKNGDWELFLVPIGPDGGGMRYEAAFSRFLNRPEGDGLRVQRLAPLAP